MRIHLTTSAVRSLSLIVVAFAANIATWACNTGSSNENPSKTIEHAPNLPDEPAPTERSPYHDRLLEIARDYKGYGRVDDEARWAPFLCRMPMPSVARFSASDEGDSHGRKMYFLFAKDRRSYLGRPKTPVAKGQVIVKESWLPVEATGRKELHPWKDAVQEDVKLDPTVHKKNPLASGRGAYLPYASKDGKLYRAAKRAGLFIMYKTEDSTPNTDQGWVYGTVTADGKRVTAAGAIQSCMACHQEAPHDRLFGLHADVRLPLSK